MGETKNAALIREGELRLRMMGLNPIEIEAWRRGDALPCSHLLEPGPIHTALHRDSRLVQAARALEAKYGICIFYVVDYETESGRSVVEYLLVQPGLEEDEWAEERAALSQGLAQSARITGKGEAVFHQFSFQLVQGFGPFSLMRTYAAPARPQAAAPLREARPSCGSCRLLVRLADGTQFCGDTHGDNDLAMGPVPNDALCAYWRQA